MVLDILQVLGHPTFLDNSRATATALAVCAFGVFGGRSFSHLSFFLFFLPLFGRQPDID